MGALSKDVACLTASYSAEKKGSNWRNGDCNSWPGDEPSQFESMSHDTHKKGLMLHKVHRDGTDLAPLKLTPNNLRLWGQQRVTENSSLSCLLFLPRVCRLD